MTKFENAILDFLKKHLLFIIAAVFTVFAVWARLLSFDFLSVDMRDYLQPWMYYIRALGRIKSLSYNIGNYNILYVTILSLLSYIKDVEHIYLIKGLSVVFDFVMAVAAALLVYDHTKEDKLRKAVLGYCVVLMLPAVYLNASVWGQCDAMYTSFLLLTLLFLGRGKYQRAFIMYGFALAFKLQAVFLLPFILFFYFKQRKFSILNLLFVPGVMLVTAIPAAIMGRPILDVFRIYFQQTSDFAYPTMLYPNGYTWLQYEKLNFVFADYITPIAVAAAFMVLLAGILFCERKEAEETSFEQYMVFAAWVCYSCVMFLPRMHERYGFPAEILLVVLALINKRYSLYAVLCSGIALISYMPFLFALFEDQTVLSFINVGVYLIFTMAELRHSFGPSKIRSEA